MSEMVERVAKALAPGVDAQPIMDHEFWCVIARRAIAAMREPTAAMLKAGARGGGEDSIGLADGIWSAMIDAALAPETGA